MKIGVGNDHRGVEIKNKIITHLEKKGHEVIDMGANSMELSNFPEYAIKVGSEVADKKIDMGILICGTGIGMSIVCNKVKGAYCAKVDNKREAFFAKSHNNANVLSFSSFMRVSKIKKLIDVYMKSELSIVPRYKKRIEMIKEFENGN